MAWIVGREKEEPFFDESEGRPAPVAPSETPGDRARRAAWVIRCLTAAAIVVGLHLVTVAVDRGSHPREFSLDAGRFHLPAQFDSWSAVPRAGVPVQPGDAAVTANQVYQRAANEAVSVQAAAWVDYDVELPHVPTNCYPNAGYAIEGEEVVSFRDAAGGVRRTRILTVQRDGRYELVLYWYQLGGVDLLEHAEVRPACWALRGKDTWPPLVKIMLQTGAVDGEQARARLLALAQRASAWSAQFQ